ncbi:MAG: hypothetical protein JKY01_09315 [Pseudomonadales bacterium]|nr:hypothetical protein [Pseudomonadales bacterium]
MALSVKLSTVSAVLVSAMAVSFISSSYALPQGGELTGSREMEVSVVSGQSLKDVLGKEFKNYSVMAVVDGVIAPIPFQFDERNSKGFLFVPGGKLTIDGTENVLDEQDELVFMFTDTGPQATAEQLSVVSGEVLSEIRVEDSSAGVSGFAYLIKGNAKRSDHHYTYYDKETGKVETEKYTLDIDPDNLLSWSDLIYKDYKPGYSLIDTMKIRIKARVGFIKATINNDLIPNHVVAVKNGPVRSIIEVDASIAILGVTLGEGGASITISNQSVQFPVYATIPKAAALLSDLTIGIALDFNKLEGAKVRTALGPEEPIIAGGGGSNPEDHRVTLEDDWLAGSTGNGYDIVAFFQGSESFKPTLNFQYEDAGRGADEDAPERYEGGHPQVGYYVSDIPNGQDIVVGVNLFFDDHLWKGNNAEDAIWEIKNPATITLSPMSLPVIAAD